MKVKVQCVQPLMMSVTIEEQHTGRKAARVA